MVKTCTYSFTRDRSPPAPITHHSLEGKLKLVASSSVRAMVLLQEKDRDRLGRARARPRARASAKVKASARVAIMEP